MVLWILLRPLCGPLNISHTGSRRCQSRTGVNEPPSHIQATWINVCSHSFHRLHQWCRGALPCSHKQHFPICAVLTTQSSSPPADRNFLSPTATGPPAPGKPLPPRLSRQLQLSWRSNSPAPILSKKAPSTGRLACPLGQPSNPLKRRAASHPSPEPKHHHEPATAAIRPAAAARNIQLS